MVDALDLGSSVFGRESSSLSVRIIFNHFNRMIPRFRNISDWEKAQVLMQPCLIRVLDNIRKQLDESSYKGTYEEVTEPIPGHILCLTYQDVQVKVDIWELCFKVCFLEYEPSQEQAVQIDDSLIEQDTGDVDWQSLESKTQYIVRQVFLKLPVQ